MSSHQPPIVEKPPHAPEPTAETPRLLEMHWPDEAATQGFATRLARGLQDWPGGTDACIELHGDLGAGKTTLVRHLLRAAGVQGRIKSPTYAVVEPHTAEQVGRPWPVWHFDFYRFNDPQEWADAGFRDIVAGPGLKLIEWPEKAAGQLPPPDLALTLMVEDDGQRLVRLQAGTTRGQTWLEALRAH